MDHVDQLAPEYLKQELVVADQPLMRGVFGLTFHAPNRQLVPVDRNDRVDRPLTAAGVVPGASVGIAVVEQACPACHPNQKGRRERLQPAARDDAAAAKPRAGQAQRQPPWSTGLSPKEICASGGSR